VAHNLQATAHKRTQQHARLGCEHSLLRIKSFSERHTPVTSTFNKYWYQHWSEVGLLVHEHLCSHQIKPTCQIMWLAQYGATATTPALSI
jgi:hypothetical protein